MGSVSQTDCRWWRIKRKSKRRRVWGLLAALTQSLSCCQAAVQSVWVSFCLRLCRWLFSVWWVWLAHLLSGVFVLLLSSHAVFVHLVTESKSCFFPPTWTWEYTFVVETLYECRELHNLRSWQAVQCTPLVIIIEHNIHGLVPQYYRTVQKYFPCTFTGKQIKEATVIERCKDKWKDF